MELPSDLSQRLQPLNGGTLSENSAAVALLLVEGESATLLVERRERLGDPWSGQMALPGGRFQAEDKNLQGTVLRETLEEVGVNLEGRLAGRLPDVVPRNRPEMLVAPFISLWQERPEILLSTEELVNHYWVGLEELRGSYGMRMIPRVNREMESYLCFGRVVWGLTARIVAMFFEVIES